MQYASSATTCLNQVNSLLKTLLPQWEGITVLDIGGGKFNTHQLYAEKFGVKLYVYDKFNRTEAENREALACRPHVILCSNVLNVIDEGQALRDVIALCAAYQVPCYFLIHEGNQSGIGKTSKKDCWQRNWKTKEYLPILRKFFRHVMVKRHLIICE